MANFAEDVAPRVAAFAIFILTHRRECSSVTWLDDPASRMRPTKAATPHTKIPRDEWPSSRAIRQA
jgi:hypothetical protein